MGKKSPHYAEVFRQRMVELVQAGRTAGELARLRKDVKRRKTARDILAEGDEKIKTVRGAVLPRNAWFAYHEDKTGNGSSNS